MIARPLWQAIVIVGFAGSHIIHELESDVLLRAPHTTMEIKTVRLGEDYEGPFVP